jgi:lipooligosaccharide transport system ATP-binding protein
LLGPNGAGKTSTVRMIHAVSPVSTGSLHVLGNRVDESPAAVKRQVGVVPQEENLDPDLSPMENLLAFARYYDIPRAEARQRAISLLDFMALTARAESPLNELSGGMKRRLLIARALLHSPRLLILDEPTAGLDPQARHLVWQRLRHLKAQGVTQVLTTHYMDEAAQLCDRVALMHAGRILCQGKPMDLVREKVGEEVIEIRIEEALHSRFLALLDGRSFHWERAGDTLYLYCADGRSLLPVLSVLRPAHLLHRPTGLEDLFLKLTGRSLQE